MCQVRAKVNRQSMIRFRYRRSPRAIKSDWEKFLGQGKRGPSLCTLRALELSWLLYVVAKSTQGPKTQREPKRQPLRYPNPYLNQVYIIYNHKSFKVRLRPLAKGLFDKETYGLSTGLYLRIDEQLHWYTQVPLRALILIPKEYNLYYIYIYASLLGDFGTGV